MSRTDGPDEPAGEVLDVDVVVEAKAEAKALVDREIEWLKESETDFMRIFRFNVLALGIFVSGASLGIRHTNALSVSHFDHHFVYLSFAFWFASTVLAVLTYGGLRAHLGCEELFQVPSTAFSDVRSMRSPDDLDEIDDAFEDTPLSDVDSVAQYHRKTLDSYVEAINANEHEAGLRYGLYNVVLLLLVFSITLFGLGIWDSVGPSGRVVGPWGAGVVIAVLGATSTLVGTALSLTNLYDKYSDKIREHRSVSDGN